MQQRRSGFRFFHAYIVKVHFLLNLFIRSKNRQLNYSRGHQLYQKNSAKWDIFSLQDVKGDHSEVRKPTLPHQRSNGLMSHLFASWQVQVPALHMCRALWQHICRAPQQFILQFRMYSTKVRGTRWVGTTVNFSCAFLQFSFLFLFLLL